MSFFLLLLFFLNLYHFFMPRGAVVYLCTALTNECAITHSVCIGAKKNCNSMLIG